MAIKVMSSPVCFTADIEQIKNEMAEVQTWLRREVTVLNCSGDIEDYPRIGPIREKLNELFARVYRENQKHIRNPSTPSYESEIESIHKLQEDLLGMQSVQEQFFRATSVVRALVSSQTTCQDLVARSSKLIASLKGGKKISEAEYYEVERGIRQLRNDLDHNMPTEFGNDINKQAYERIKAECKALLEKFGQIEPLLDQTTNPEVKDLENYAHESVCRVFSYGGKIPTEAKVEEMIRALPDDFTNRLYGLIYQRTPASITKTWGPDGGKDNLKTDLEITHGAFCDTLREMSHYKPEFLRYNPSLGRQEFTNQNFQDAEEAFFVCWRYRKSSEILEKIKEKIEGLPYEFRCAFCKELYSWYCRAFLREDTLEAVETVSFVQENLSILISEFNRCLASALEANPKFRPVKIEPFITEDEPEATAEAARFEAATPVSDEESQDGPDGGFWDVYKRALSLYRFALDFFDLSGVPQSYLNRFGPPSASSEEINSLSERFETEFEKMPDDVKDAFYQKLSDYYSPDYFAAVDEVYSRPPDMDDLNWGKFCIQSDWGVSQDKFFDVVTELNYFTESLVVQQILSKLAAFSNLEIARKMVKDEIESMPECLQNAIYGEIYQVHKENGRPAEGLEFGRNNVVTDLFFTEVAVKRAMGIPVEELTVMPRSRATSPMVAGGAGRADSDDEDDLGVQPAEAPSDVDKFSHLTEEQRELVREWVESGKYIERLVKDNRFDDAIKGQLKTKIDDMFNKIRASGATEADERLGSLYGAIYHYSEDPYKGKYKVEGKTPQECPPDLNWGKNHMYDDLQVLYASFSAGFFQILEDYKIKQ